jgi:hypothetical protein
LRTFREHDASKALSAGPSNPPVSISGAIFQEQITDYVYTRFRRAASLMGAVMSRKKLRHGVGGSSDRFIQMPHYMLKSPAWRSLPSEAKALLLEVWQRHNGANNGEITFACSEAPKLLGFSAATASRMFKILRDRGFLVIVRDAQFKLRTKNCRTWRITIERYRDEAPTKEFMRWRPDINDLAKAEVSPVKPDINDLAKPEKHSSVSPVKPIGFTREIKDAEMTPSVSPVQPKHAIQDQNRFHPCNTYNIPCNGRASSPLPADWKPGRRATVEAKVEGLRHGLLAAVVSLFKERYVGSNVISDDWLREFRNFVREFVQAEKQRAGEFFGPAALKKPSTAGKGTPT